MKLLKTIFYTLIIFILALFVGVLLCATNPDLTNSLAALLYGTEHMEGILGQNEEKAEATEGEAVNASLDDGIKTGSGTISEIESAEDASKDTAKDNANNPESKEDSESGSKDNIEVAVLPTAVSGKSGYVPIGENDEQITDSVAKTLRESVGSGPTGDDLSFDPLFYPFYYMLDTEQQKLYKQLYANAMELNASFAPASSIQANKVKDTFEAVVGDHPELYFLETGYSVKYTQTGQVIEIALSYYTFANDMDKARTAFDSAVNSIVSVAQNMGSDYEKEKFVHNTLISWGEYNTYAKFGQSAYSLLVNGETVCAGYARAFQLIMQKLGIPCYYCTGFSGESHAWNIIKIGDGYLNVDVTWDDTVPATYDFFNGTDAMYAGTHLRQDLSVNLPPCNGTEYVGLEKKQEPSVSEEEVNALNAALGSNSGNENRLEAPLSYDKDKTSLPEGSSDDSQKKDSDHSSGAQEDSSSGTGDSNDGTVNTELSEAEKLLSKLGLTKEDVAWSLEEYYKDCLNQMVSSGLGGNHFSVIIPSSLYNTIEAEYGKGAQLEGYINEALQTLGGSDYTLQLQIQSLGTGFVKIYHNMVTW